MAKITIWEIDGSHSSVQFAITDPKVAAVRGRFTELSGTIHVDEENPDLSSVEAEIAAASLVTGNPERDRYLRSADCLDVDNFPAIVFQSKQVDGAAGQHFRIGGNLIILGRSVPVVFDVSFTGLAHGPWGQRARFSASAQIDRRDWGLEWKETPEGGAAGHAMSVQIDVEAVEPHAAGIAAA